MTSTLHATRPTAPPRARPTPVLTIVVIGARDSGAADLAAHLQETTVHTVHLGSTQVNSPPDLCLVAIEATCPIRPDDLDVAVRCARSTAVAVVLTGIAAIADWRDSAAVSTDRLHAAGLGAPVVWAGDYEEPRDTSLTDSDGSAPRSASALVKAAQQAAKALPQITRSADPQADDAATADWLQVKRTETISTRSAALRRHTHAARMTLSAAITAGLRPIAVDGKMALLARPRRELPTVVDQLTQRADAIAVRLVSNATMQSTRLRQRHLAESSESAVPAAPSLGFSLTFPPRHKGEELVLITMGAAAGTGVGRLVATPFADVWPILVPIMVCTLIGGCFLGMASVRARRTAALRHHLIGVLTEQCAALRSDLDHVVNSLLLETEAAISDAFAHDPGPRARALDHRIRQLRHRLNTPLKDKP